MTNRITQKTTALVLAVMVTASVLAGLDVLAASEAGAERAPIAQAVTGTRG